MKMVMFNSYVCFPEGNDQGDFPMLQNTFAPHWSSSMALRAPEWECNNADPTMDISVLKTQ